MSRATVRGWTLLVSPGPLPGPTSVLWVECARGRPPNRPSYGARLPRASTRVEHRGAERCAASPALARMPGDWRLAEQLLHVHLVARSTTTTGV